MAESLNDIYGVLVIYKMDLESSATFISLMKALKGCYGILNLLVYNNSPDYKIKTGKIYHNLSITIINDYTNAGVSKAYNKAYGEAKGNGKKWILLLDQDTTLPSVFFQRFFDTRINNSHTRLFLPIIEVNERILSPGYYVPYRGFYRTSIKRGIHKTSKLAIINSGIIIETSLFQLAGMYNEDVKLDFSDVSFFRRVKVHCKYAYVMDARCFHDFSGSDNNLDSIKNRYKLFLLSAKAFSVEKGVSKILLFITILSRTMSLTIKFKTFYFIRKFKYWYYGEI